MTTNTTNIATLANSLGKLGKLNKKQLLALVERTYNDQNDPELKRVMAVIYKSIAPSVAIGKAEKDNWRGYAKPWQKMTLDSILITFIVTGFGLSVLMDTVCTLYRIHSV